MRIEVPERAFEALKSFRMRKGTMSLLDIEAVKSDFIANGYELEVDWLLENEEAVKRGALLGFVKEGEPLPLDKPLESEDTGDIL